jgi:hypothetical protein
MTIQELVKILRPIDDIPGDSFQLTGTQLYEHRLALSDCDEFKGANLHIIENPIVNIYGVNRHVTSTMLPVDGALKFNFNCYLYSIETTPLMVNPYTFEPERKLLVRGIFNSEFESARFTEPSEIVSVYESWTDKWSYKL